jgi:serine/threonine protein kinase
VTHPNVVAFIDAGRVGDAPYLVTEVIRGISLRDLIEQGAVRAAARTRDRTAVYSRLSIRCTASG